MADPTATLADGQVTPAQADIRLRRARILAADAAAGA